MDWYSDVIDFFFETKKPIALPIPKFRCPSSGAKSSSNRRHVSKNGTKSGMGQRFVWFPHQGYGQLDQLRFQQQRSDTSGPQHWNAKSIYSTLVSTCETPGIGFESWFSDVFFWGPASAVSLAQGWAKPQHQQLSRHLIFTENWNPRFLSMQRMEHWSTQFSQDFPSQVLYFV